MVKNFNVEFRSGCGGWGSFKVLADSQEAVIETSFAFDPYEDLIEWLGNIVDGKEESAIEINEEGPTRAMVARQSKSDFILNFIVKDFDLGEGEEYKQYIDVDIEKSVLIQEFLNKYKNFLESGFDPLKWFLYRKDFPNLLGMLKELELKYNRPK